MEGKMRLWWMLMRILLGVAVIGFSCRYAWASSDVKNLQLQSAEGDAPDWKVCVEDDWSCCLYFYPSDKPALIPERAIPSNNFVEDASLIGGMSVVFAGLGGAVSYRFGLWTLMIMTIQRAARTDHKTPAFLPRVYRAFKHFEWLPSSIALLVYSMICIQSYYASSVMIPEPGTLTSSLALLTRYVASNPYSDIGKSIGEDVDDQCHVAQIVNYVFVVLQYVLVGCLLLLLAICLCGEAVRLQSPRKHRYAPLVYGEVPRALTLATCIAYMICVGAKNVVAFETAVQFENRSEELPSLFPKTSYPYAETALDVQTILLVSGTMAVIRGSTRQSVSALRFSALASLFYVILLTPSILGSMYAGVVFDILGTDDACEDFFDILYGVNGDLYKDVYQIATLQQYPGTTDERAQTTLCYASRVALLSGLLLYIFQILQCFASGYAFFANQHRQSEILDYVFSRSNGEQASDSLLAAEHENTHTSSLWQGVDDLERKESP